MTLTPIFSQSGIARKGMEMSTFNITRDNMLDCLPRVRTALEDSALTKDEALRLLDEALHVMHRQQESRRVAKQAAERAAHAAGSLLMPKD